MIKINLLAEGKRPILARKARSPLLGATGAMDAANMGLIVTAIVGLLAGVGWYFLVQHQLNAKRDEVNAAQKEVDELAQVIREVDEYKAKKAELERKIDVINQLKENQRGPVQIMDQVSRALPELLWLSSMDVFPTTINLRGSALNMTAVANYMDNLDRVPEFQEPVLIDATQRVVNERTEIYDFNVNFSYSFKKAAQISAPPGAAPQKGAKPGAVGKAQANKDAKQQAQEGAE